jgi:hypothetical protein
MKRVEVTGFIDFFAAKENKVSSILPWFLENPTLYFSCKQVQACFWNSVFLENKNKKPPSIPLPFSSSP